MRSLLLSLAFISFAAAIARFESTVVDVTVTLRCKKSWSSSAKVFLMESDFYDNVLDEDDTMDFGNYEFKTGPETQLRLHGEEFEFSGLDPYIHVSHTCGQTQGGYDTYNLPLMEGMYKSRFFDIIIDLDTGKANVKSTILHP